ncbi:MAG: hypothetical protein ABR540_15930 [Acidimicrobiales bacterium]
MDVRKWRGAATVERPQGCRTRGSTALIGILLLVATATAAACGDGDGEGAATREADGLTSTAPEATRPVLSGVLSRRDVVPSDAEATYSYFAGGDAPCQEPDDPRSIRVPATIYVPDRVAFCFGTTFLQRDTTVTFQPPSGAAQTETLRGLWVYRDFLPGDPLGEYRITAQAGSDTATATFRLVRPQQPWLVVFEPHVGPPGTTFRAAFSGFRPAEKVRIHVCRRTPYQGGRVSLTCDYLTTLAIDADGNGESVFSIQTMATDPVGEYCLISPTIAQQLPPDLDDCQNTFKFSLVAR